MVGGRFETSESMRVASADRTMGTVTSVGRRSDNVVKSFSCCWPAPAPEPPPLLREFRKFCTMADASFGAEDEALGKKTCQQAVLFKMDT